jgi:hypothetical protein
MALLQARNFDIHLYLVIYLEKFSFSENIITEYQIFKQQLCENFSFGCKSSGKKKCPHYNLLLAKYRSLEKSFSKVIAAFGSLRIKYLGQI